MPSSLHEVAERTLSSLIPGPVCLWALHVKQQKIYPFPKCRIGVSVRVLGVRVAVPSIVMEVGIFETMAQLNRGRDEWFQFTEVLTVILVKIWTGQDTMADAVEIFIWTRGQNQMAFKRTAWRHTPHADDLVLYLSDFFNPAEMPAHLNGSTVVTVPLAQLVLFIENVCSELRDNPCPALNPLSSSLSQ